MDAIRFPQVDAIAVAPGCFDLPQSQCLDLCGVCHGKGEIVGRECAECGGLGYIRVRLISRWMFTEAEFQYMIDHPESRGVWLHVCAVQTPPVLVTTVNAFEAWKDVVPVKSLTPEQMARLQGLQNPQE